MSSSVEVPEAATEFPGTPVQHGKPAPGSLEARIAERRDALEQVTTEVFDVPRYEGILRVELKVVGTKQQFSIVESAERIPDRFGKAMFVGGELLARATVRFFAVNKETGEDEEAEGFTWLQAARSKFPELPDDTPARVAILRILTDEGLSDLAGAWREWLANRGQKLDARLERDFT